jgi:hypothetical protein
MQFSLVSALKVAAFLSLVAFAGCGGGGCCSAPANPNRTGGVIPGGGVVVTVPGVTVGGGTTVTVPIVGTGPFTAAGCPGIVNATVNGNIVTLVSVGVGVCVVVITGPGGITGSILVTVTAAAPLVVTPVTVVLGPGGTGNVTITGPGPFTVTGCPGIINATVTGNVVNLVAVGIGVCAVIVTGPGGVQATILVTASATVPLALAPPVVQIGNGAITSIPITGTGPFTATGCPGIVNATVTGNVLNLAAVGVGVCVVVVVGPGGVTATVLTTVTAAVPLVALPTTLGLAPGGTGSIAVTGAGPFTATGCPGIINATVTGNVVNVAAVGVGVCAIVVTGPGGVQATVIATVLAATPLALTPTNLILGPGGTGAVGLTGTGPFTATGCPGIVNATVTGNVLNLVGVGVGVCVVVVVGPGGVQATVLATVVAVAPLVVAPTNVLLGNGGATGVAITGTGPFTATGCPGIINATVTGNVLNLAAVGVGACVVVVLGPGGVQATVLATVTAAVPLVATPPALGLLVGNSAPVTISGIGPISAVGCPGIVNVSVAAQIVNVTAVGVGVCAVVVTGPGGVQAIVLVTAT